MQVGEQMLYVKNISYMFSHVFFLAFIYVFLVHRYSRKKTLGICFLSCFAMNLPDYFKLNIFTDNPLFYFCTTIIQIAIAQLTGLFISRTRNAKTLFIGLSASNYVVVGSITASILYIFTGSVNIALAGNLLMHLAILLILYHKIGDIFRRFLERELKTSWWGLCLIPVFFFCCFSLLL